MSTITHYHSQSTIFHSHSHTLTWAQKTSTLSLTSGRLLLSVQTLICHPEQFTGKKDIQISEHYRRMYKYLSIKEGHTNIWALQTDVQMDTLVDNIVSTWGLDILFQIGSFVWKEGHTNTWALRTDGQAEGQTDRQMDELADGLADNILSPRGLDNSPCCFLIKSMAQS